MPSEAEVLEAIVDAYRWLRGDAVNPPSVDTVERLVFAARAWLEIVEEREGR